MKIRKLKAKEIKEAADLVRRTYSIFNKKEGSKKAVQSYLDLYDSNKNFEKVKKMFLQNEIALVAINNKKIIGIVRGGKNRVFNLYVDRKYHDKGIGKILMERFEKEAIKRGSKEIRIRSSLYAAPFYKKIGYKKTTGIRMSPRLYYLKYQPMIKKLK